MQRHTTPAAVPLSAAMPFMTENRKPETAHDLWYRRGPGEGGPD